MHLLQPAQLRPAVPRQHGDAAGAGLEGADLVAMRAEQGERVAVATRSQRVVSLVHAVIRSAREARPRSGTPIQAGRFAAS